MNQVAVAFIPFLYCVLCVCVFLAIQATLFVWDLLFQLDSLLSDLLTLRSEKSSSFTSDDVGFSVRGGAALCSDAQKRVEADIFSPEGFWLLLAVTSNTPHV